MRSFRWNRRRGLAATTGALLFTIMLAISGVVGDEVDETLAQWNDTETATADLTAEWMQGFARVTDPGWKMRNEQRIPAQADSPPSSPVSETRNFTLTYPHGTSPTDGNDDARNSFGNNEDTSIVPERRTLDNLWMGRYRPPSFFDLNSDIARAGHCMSYPEPSSFTATTDRCGATPGTPARISSHQNTLGYTFSIYSSGSKLSRVNVSGFSSTALCYPNGESSAVIHHDDDSVLNLANEAWILGVPNARYRDEESIKNIIPSDASDSPHERYDGTTDQWIKYKVNNQLSSDNANFVLAANIRKNTYTTDYYALAEMDLVVQIYSSGGASLANGTFIDQVNLPLTRSECGFSDGTHPLPSGAGTWRGDPNQLGWPGRSLGNTATDMSGRAEQYTFEEVGTAPTVSHSRVAPQHRVGATPTNELPPTTTVTSTRENTTASSTTTSAPPNPEDEESTTSARSTTTTATATTSTRGTTETTATTPPPTRTPSTNETTPSTSVPLPEIPSEPGRLSATARTEDVTTVEVGEEKHLVVVGGGTVPTDARQGAAALGTWLGDGTPDANWVTFTADDPDEAGWRWAAINRETGTIVYIR